MTSILFVGFAIALAILLYLLLKLLSISQFQAQKIEATELQLESEENNLAALIISAKGMDEKIVLLEQRLLNAEEQLLEASERSQEDPSYHSAIRQAQSGASVQELVDECNISREEADLIIRLYGSDEVVSADKG
jgi:hypothetical protein